MTVPILSISNYTAFMFDCDGTLVDANGVAIPGVTALAVRIGAFGPVAVVSGGDRDEIMKKLAKAGLYNIFGECVFAKTDTIRAKPAPDAYLKVSSSLKVTPNKCLVFEDSANGIKAAQTAGMDVIDITKLFQLIWPTKVIEI
jgi:beta-phosphoglucomutase-like phosphatase (HAD superfamily)